jgi:hypothetical protein
MIKILLLFLTVSFLLGCNSVEPVKNDLDSGFKKGLIVTIRTNGTVTYVGKDKETIELFVKAIVEKKQESLNILRLSGKLFVVEDGTKAEVIQDGMVTQVVIVDGKFKDTNAWVIREWLKE